MIYLLTPIVIQSEAKNLGNIYVNTLLYATEILPPFGRLNDKWCQDVYCSLKLYMYNEAILKAETTLPSAQLIRNQRV